MIRFVDGWKLGKRVVVVGDFMLDRYVYGNADRLSPDTPVPVLSVASLTEGVKNNAGGAGNVCVMLRHLGCDVHCIGMVGDDNMADMLTDELTDSGCNTVGLIRARDSRRTTVKFNIVGLAQHRHAQKMFRIDVEDKDPIDDRTASRLLSRARKSLRGAAALCIEDYNKGVLTESLCQQLIVEAKKLGVPVLVDPAAIDDYTRYRGATSMTPNRTEAQKATGVVGHDEDSVELMARTLMKRLRLKTIVLTLDKQGALLLEGRKKPRLIPTVARDVYDVTGAGDMVLAMLAGALANGAEWATAVRLANVAAGLEVEHFGVVPIALEEVLLALLERQHEELGKVRSLDQLMPELAAHKKAGKSVVFTNGCFDILHAGHVSFLREARRQGDLLVVGVNSDKSIKRIKGEGRPVNKQIDRMMVLSELESVDYLVVFDDDTPIDLVSAIKPDVIVKGGDYTPKTVVGADVVTKAGGRVVIVDLIKGRSTTNIIKKAKRS